MYGIICLIFGHKVSINKDGRVNIFCKRCKKSNTSVIKQGLKLLKSKNLTNS